MSYRSARNDRRARGDRWQRYRARVAAGRKVGLFEYDGEVLDFLIRTHWLSENDAADARAVGDAIAEAARRG